MRLNLINLTHGFRCCACCGLDFYSCDWICIRCQNFLNSKIKNLQTTTLGSGILLRYLFDWSKDNFELVQSLALSLKGNYSSRGYSWVSKTFASLCILSDLFLEKSSIIIPVPYNNKKRKHTFVFALELSKQLGFKMDTNLLSYESKSTQKSLSKKERGNIQIKSLGHSYKNIIIVDDVCTTGSTIKSTKEALTDACKLTPKIQAFVFAKKCINA